MIKYDLIVSPNNSAWTGLDVAKDGCHSELHCTTLRCVAARFYIREAFMIHVAVYGPVKLHH